MKLLIILLTVAFAQAQHLDNTTTNTNKKWNMIWGLSVVTMVGATTADAASSYNSLEGNALLRSSNGNFGTKGIAIKSMMGAGVITTQCMFPKHRKLEAFVNLGLTAFFSWGTYHNTHINAYSNPSPNEYMLGDRLGNYSNFWAMKY